MGKYNYSGKTIYMGIDVHKKTWTCVSICEGQVVKKDCMAANEKALHTYIRKQFRGAKVYTAYEAGFSGFYLHRFLCDHKIKNMVVHPGSLEVASRDRVKTDKRDAKKLATQLSVGRLTSVYIPSKELEAKRSLTRTRQQLLRTKVTAGNRFKSLLFTQGLISPSDDKPISKKWIEKKLAEAKKAGHLQSYIYSLEQHAQLWNSLDDQIKSIVKTIDTLQSKDEKKLLAIYRSMPGIGLISSLILKDELGDMSQFSTESKLSSYLGLTPTEHASGEHSYKGHISRQSRSILRSILVEAAWMAIRKDGELRFIYERLYGHRGGKKAIVAVARHMATRLRSCLQRGESYEVREA